MRTALSLLIIFGFCAPTIADTADRIAPGITLTTATAILQKHGCEVDAKKYGLAIDTRNPGNRLEFCPIDSNFTLVIEYTPATEQIVGLDVVIYPDSPTNKRQMVLREIFEVGLKDTDICTLTFRRKARAVRAADENSR